MDLWLPVAPDLLAAIQTMLSVGIKTYIVSELGRPFSKGGEQGDEPPDDRRRGWVNEEEISTYAEAADREALADAGMATIMNKYSTGDDSNDA